MHELIAVLIPEQEGARRGEDIDQGLADGELGRLAGLHYDAWGPADPWGWSGDFAVPPLPARGGRPAPGDRRVQSVPRVLRRGHVRVGLSPRRGHRARRQAPSRLGAPRERRVGGRLRAVPHPPRLPGRPLRRPLLIAARSDGGRRRRRTGARSRPAGALPPPGGRLPASTRRVPGSRARRPREDDRRPLLVPCAVTTALLRGWPFSPRSWGVLSSELPRRGKEPRSGAAARTA